MATWNNNPLPVDVLVHNSSVRAGFGADSDGKRNFWVVGLKADIYGVTRVIRRFLVKKYRAKFSYIPFLGLGTRFEIEGIQFGYSIDYLAGLNIFSMTSHGEAYLTEIGRSISDKLNEPGVKLPEYWDLTGAAITLFRKVQKDKSAYLVLSVVPICFLTFILLLSGNATVLIKNQNMLLVKNVIVRTNIDQHIITSIGPNEMVKIELKRKKLFDAVVVSYVGSNGKKLSAVGANLSRIYEFDILGNGSIYFIDRREPEDKP